MTQNQQRIIPIYSSRGEAEAFLTFPYLFNRGGEWIGWVTPQRDVYSVMGYYVGYLTNDPRIVRKRATNALKPRLQPPCTLPSRLVCSMCMSCESVTREALMGLGVKELAIVGYQ